MDIADVVTRVAFDPDKQFVMSFNAAAFADDDRTLQVIQYIDENKLSDVAVGRNDVPCDPELVKAMLAGRPAQQQIAAPAEKAAASQGQTFALPPRTNGAAPAEEKPAPEKPPSKSRKPPQQALSPAEQVEQATQTGDIPAFLKQQRETQASDGPLPSTPPRFGVGQAPPPPAEIADALSKAMALPTRR